MDEREGRDGDGEEMVEVDVSQLINWLASNNRLRGSLV